MVRFYQLEPVRFACTGCGKCCTGGSEYFVFLSREEAAAIQRDLGISWDWFRKRYLSKHLESNNWVLNSDLSGQRCVFLLADNSCKVYNSRPLQCKTYPFWPEVVKTRAAWKAEASRCEGIGRGLAIAPSVVSETVSVVEEYDEKLESGDC